MDDVSIRDVIRKLDEIASTLDQFDKKGVLAKLDELRETVMSLTPLQLDLRMLRMRLKAMMTDPDKTPIEPLIARKSSATLPRVDPKKYEQNDE